MALSPAHTPACDTLFEAMMRLQTVDEYYALFEDLCTIKELRDMSQRYQVACMLEEGLTYQEIVDATTVSTATIGRVSRCLNYGSGGYRLAMRRQRGEKEEDVE